MPELIGQLLYKKKLINKANLESAISECRSNGMRIGEFLIRQKGFSEKDFYYSLAEQFTIPFLENLEENVNRDLLREYPAELFNTGRCMPISIDDNIFKIAVIDPLDLDIIFEAESISGLLVEISLVLPSEMMELCGKLFKGENFFKESIGKISREYRKNLAENDSQLSLAEIIKNTESEPVVKIVSLIFEEALKRGASDIHVEPSENNAVIRFRIDGMLKQYMEITKWMYTPFTSRIKILAELDIAEKRVPQDGRIRYEFNNQIFDFRVSTLPTHYGEKTVIRVLKHDMSLLELKNLGIESKELSFLYDVIEKPQGMIFVTGPTGSGKSSTLFASLNRIRKKEINITTIENPIEYKLDGINQVQINEKAGVTFASVLRSILRQDPDVILIGEIRDRETAEIAIQASQTGHLVFSTLHTNDAVSAITRLKDLGIPGFLISSSLLAIIAQRLVRVLCPVCRIKQKVTDELKIRWKKTIGEISFKEAYFSIGCDKCFNTGFSGRKGIFEMIPVNDDIRAMITENASETEIRNFVHKHGIKSMIQNGIEKIKDGITTPEEVLRVVLVENIIE